jgi:uncharacterized membrane protein HdeD (DUF308 family)
MRRGVDPMRDTPTLATRHGWRHGASASAALRGLAALALGVCALAWPEASLAVLLALLAGYTALSGGAALALAYRVARFGAPAWPLIVYAVVALAVTGVIALWAAPVTMVMVTLFAAWMVVSGLSELVLASRLRGVLPHVWPLALTGVASLAFAWVLLVEPPWAAAVAVRLVGVYAVLSGAFLLGLAFRLRTWDGPVAERSS